MPQRLFMGTHARMSAAAPRRNKRIVAMAAQIVAMTAATPQKRAAATAPEMRAHHAIVSTAAPAVRRGDERQC